MRETIRFQIDNIRLFKKQFFNFFKKCKYFIYLDNNEYPSYLPEKEKNTEFDIIAGYGLHRKLESRENGFSKLQDERKTNADWIFGILAYDLKNENENLSSENKNRINFPNLLFFSPKIVFYIKQNELVVEYLPQYSNREDIRNKIQTIQTKIPDETTFTNKLKIKEGTSKNEYLQIVSALKEHIRQGNIYEINYCTEFYAQAKGLEMSQLFSELNKLSPSPFAGYLKFNNYHLLSASPERFVKKIGRRIISQPMKGTAARGSDTEKDIRNAEILKNDPKERAENIMISDLVRNDLSRTAARGSVKADKMCGVYKFPHVFQMISTISSDLHPSCSGTDALQAAFPPGSMTGAPKIRAMQLSEKFENFKRSWYAGSLGYFTPNDDFDFNVIIRSILYNSENGILSFAAGGAITDLSEPEKEYEECLLKTKAIRQLLGDKGID